MRVVERIKVLHVAECIGGVDRFLRCLLKYSDREKFENILLLSQLYDKEVYEKFSEHVEIMEMHHSMGLVAVKTAAKIRKRIKHYKPDVVVAHSSIAGAFTRMACIGLKCKVVYNPHGWSFNMESRKQKLFISLEKIMAHFCNSIVCISDAERVSALDKKICRENKLKVIYNGIDLQTEIEHIDIGAPEEAFVVGMVGRICRQKAPDVFVKMAAEVKKEIESVFFIIVGDVLEGKEEERKEIEKLAEENGVSLKITGWVSNPLSYISQFDVGCLLSRWEGFGLAIPEYMECGASVVATNVDAVPYLIKDGVNGMLVEKDDWKAAAEKVVEIKKNERLRNILIENGRKEVKEKFDARRVSKEYEELYEVLLS